MNLAQSFKAGKSRAHRSIVASATGDLQASLTRRRDTQPDRFRALKDMAKFILPLRGNRTYLNLCILHGI